MRVLGIDLETTGLNVEQDRIIELGACIWDTETQMPIEFLSILVKPEAGLPLSLEVKDVTGITDELLERIGFETEYATAHLIEMAKRADCFCAHNGTDFDKPLLAVEGSRQPQRRPRRFSGHWSLVEFSLPF